MSASIIKTLSKTLMTTFFMISALKGSQEHTEFCIHHPTRPYVAAYSAESLTDPLMDKNTIARSILIMKKNENQQDEIRGFVPLHEELQSMRWDKNGAYTLYIKLPGGKKQTVDVKDMCN
jgi:hypothetical protein